MLREPPQQRTAAVPREAGCSQAVGGDGRLLLLLLVAVATDSRIARSNDD
jgi:hypothetical protein